MRVGAQVGSAYHTEAASVRNCVAVDPSKNAQPAAICLCVFPLQICQSDYSRDLLEWIEPDNLPDWLGGRSKGTLLDDVGPWSDPEVLRRIEGQSAVAAKALKRMSSAVPSVSGSEGPPQLVVMDELADGYHSPRYDPTG